MVAIAVYFVFACVDLARSCSNIVFFVFYHQSDLLLVLWRKFRSTRGWQGETCTYLMFGVSGGFAGSLDMDTRIWRCTAVDGVDPSTQPHTRVCLLHKRAPRSVARSGLGGGMGVKSNVDCRCGVRSCLGTPVVVSTGTVEHRGGGRSEHCIYSLTIKLVSKLETRRSCAKTHFCASCGICEISELRLK